MNELTYEQLDELFNRVLDLWEKLLPHHEPPNEYWLLNLCTRYPLDCIQYGIAQTANQVAKPGKLTTSEAAIRYLFGVCRNANNAIAEIQKVQEVRQTVDKPMYDPFEKAMTEMGITL